MESHVLVGVGTTILSLIVQVGELVSVFVQYQVAIRGLAGIEQTEVIEHCPFVVFIVSFASLLFVMVAHLDTEADGAAFFWYLHQNTADILVVAIEFLGGIVHVLFADVESSLLIVRHIVGLSEYGHVEGVR